MGFHFNKDFIKKYIALLLCILGAILFYKFLDNLGVVVGSVVAAVRYLLNILLPILLGALLAYFLFRPMYWIERKVLMKLKGAEKHPKAVRFWAVFIVYAIALVAFVGFLTMLIPSTVDSVLSLVDSLPGYLDKIEELLRGIAVRNPSMTDTLAGINARLEALRNIKAGEIFNIFGGMVQGQSATQFEDLAINIAKHAVTGVIALVAALFSGFYLMLDKEVIMGSLDRLNRNIMSEQLYDGCHWAVQTIDDIFYRYFAGKILTSALIGLICYVGLLILRVKYAPLIAIVVGVTNVIPYFGPVCGGVVGVLLTLLYDPMLALWVGIWVLIVQQFDGNILGPNVLGRIVELNAFWVLFCVLIGGSLFGPFGMFVAIPVGAVVRVFINEGLDRHEKAKQAVARPEVVNEPKTENNGEEATQESPDSESSEEEEQ